MSNEEMGKAHRRDYRTKNSLRDMIVTFSAHADATPDLWPKTYQAIQEVIGLLSEQESHLAPEVWA
jgi:hypothetical protein